VPLLLPATRIAEAAAARGLRGPVILASGAEDEAVVAALVGWQRGGRPPARATIPGGGDDPAARPSH